jgi:hypothetical protein
MEHYDIEDSFKRFVVPRLEVEWVIMPGEQRGGADGIFRTVIIDIYLRNPTPVTARFPYITLSGVGGANVRDPSMLRYRKQSDEHHFFGVADDVIHPGLTRQVAQLRTPEIRVEPQGSVQCRILRGSLQPVRVTYQCGCYNSRPTVGQFTASDDELVERGIEGGFIH